MTNTQLFYSLLLIVVMTRPVFGERFPETPLASLREQLTQEYGGRVPREWGETVQGVFTHMKTRDRVIALTFDACGSGKGKGYDAALFAYLERLRIPATLFVNARWIDANPLTFKVLAANPLFEIANHGLRHRPASVTGKSVYGVNGTGTISELVEEIEGNARKIAMLTGKRPRYYRSGTAYYDEIAVQISRKLEHGVVGFTILGDAGATYRREQVKSALLKATPGDIALLHMNHPESGTAAGVMDAVPELLRRGFRFVTLSEYPLD